MKLSLPPGVAVGLLLSSTPRVKLPFQWSTQCAAVRNLRAPILAPLHDAKPLPSLVKRIVVAPGAVVAESLVPPWMASEPSPTVSCPPPSAQAVTHDSDSAPRTPSVPVRARVRGEHARFRV